MNDSSCYASPGKLSTAALDRVLKYIQPGQVTAIAVIADTEAASREGPESGDSGHPGCGKMRGGSRPKAEIASPVECGY